MRTLILAVYMLTFSAISINVLAQAEKPKLVVGIIVDQMRQEYLYRFQDRYSEDGFNRLMSEGFMFKNAHFNYVPTYTGPGHASVYTGTTPAYHGIIANDWYQRAAREMVYCAADPAYNTVGTKSDLGKMSPHRLLATTITDELKLSTQQKAIVLGMSIKDRGAVFPAGHLGEAFWYDKKFGDFITSDFYMDKLPEWVASFNKKKHADKYLSKKWETLYKINTYSASGDDEQRFESTPLKDQPVFPYSLKKGAYDQIPYTPYGNDILADFALHAIKSTDIGKDDVTDMLAVSFSSTDYIGHGFGPDSKEVEDTYLRLDRNIADILKALDDKVGKGNYTVFLTADHAVAHVPQFLIDNRVASGYFKMNQMDSLNDQIAARFGKGEYLLNAYNNQVFLNRELINKNGLSLSEVQQHVADLLMGMDGIARAYPASVINAIPYGADGVKGLLARGYNQKRSGDVLVAFEPGWIVENHGGTTHGSAYTYDTHVPVVWYGAQVPQGESVRRCSITDIAPTLSMMLDITLPNGATGEPLRELFAE